MTAFWINLLLKMWDTTQFQRSPPPPLKEHHPSKNTEYSVEICTDCRSLAASPKVHLAEPSSV